MGDSTQQNADARDEAANVENKLDIAVTQVAPSGKKRPLPVDLPLRRIILDRLNMLRAWRKYVGMSLYFLTVLLLLSGLLYWKFFIDGMNRKYISAGSNTYSFLFLKPATATPIINGMQGYASDYDHRAVIGTLMDLPQLCALKGSPYKLAFTVQVYGVTRPVCISQDSQGYQIYTLTFTTNNQYYEFMVTYGDTPNSNVYPTLRSIFESIQVSN